jgi:MFS transporter, MCT family, solute carrier family 16 (monocarboxylic acid transporters), member 10
MKAAEADAWRPRDGGLHGWLVVVASFCVNGLVFGLINSYSLIFAELQKQLKAEGDPDASSKAGEFTLFLS